MKLANNIAELQKAIAVFKQSEDEFASAMKKFQDGIRAIEKAGKQAIQAEQHKTLMLEKNVKQCWERVEQGRL